MAESCFFIYKFPKQTTKQVLAALTVDYLLKWHWEYAGKAMFFDKSATKNVVFKLICNGIK
jgi:hypothetical protein